MHIPNIEWNNYDFISQSIGIKKFYEIIVNKNLEEVFYQHKNINLINIVYNILKIN